MIANLTTTATALAALLVIVGLVVLPGRAFARHLLPEARVRPVSISIALGITWLVVTSEVLLYVRWWKPAALIPASLLMTALAYSLPVARPRHGCRTRDVRSTAAAVALGLVVGATAVSMARARYSDVEITTLQSAWDRSSNGAAFPSRSATSILQWLVLPMRAANAGTLLASRWIGLLFAAAALALAYRCVALRVRADRRMALVVLLAAGASLSQGVRFMDIATVGAPFLFAGMALLVRPPRGPVQPVLAGLALGIAALSAPTTALAAGGVLVTVTMRSLRPANPADGVAHLAVSLLVTISATLMSVAGTVFAAHLGIDVPGFAFAAQPHAFGGLRVSPFATIAILFGIGAATSWVPALYDPIRRTTARVNPLLLTALVGSVAGSLLVDAPAGRTGFVVVLVGLCCIAEAAWPNTAAEVRLPGFDDVPRRPVPLVSHLRSNSSADRAAVALAIVMLVGALAAAGLAARRPNTAQLASLREITERTTSREWVLSTNPSVPVMRRSVGPAEIDRATIAIADAETLAADPELRSRLERDFAPTAVRGVWVRVLALSSGF